MRYVLIYDDKPEAERSGLSRTRETQGSSRSLMTMVRARDRLIAERGISPECLLIETRK